MKISISTALIAAIICSLLIPAVPVRADSTPSISEWDATIQFISTEGYQGWPGISSRTPMDISAEGQRIWLIWPQAVISLDTLGRTDEKTLLALYASTGNKQDSWSAEKGLICSDGVWRSYDESTGILEETNLFTGVFSKRPAAGPGSAAIYPGWSANLLAMDTGTAGLLLSGSAGGTVEYQPLKSAIPLVGLAAASRTSRLLAWQIPGNPFVQVVDFDTGNTLADISSNGQIWTMDWSGNRLILGGPGRLTAIEIDAEKNLSSISVLEDERVPARWYRIRGAEEMLLIHAPEKSTVAVLGNANTPEMAASGSDFPSLLKSRAIYAGMVLEDAGLADTAVSFYNWVLPLVRTCRSDNPLDADWANLEKDLSDRRAMLQETTGLSPFDKTRE